MRVYRLYEATTDVEALSTKHQGLWDAAKKFERLLANELVPREFRLSGLGLSRHGQPAAIFKARVLYPQLRGKSSGPRYIYERFTLEDVEYAVVLIVYVHQGGKSEQENRALIKQRFQLYNATMESLRKLDHTDTDSYFD